MIKNNFPGKFIVIEGIDGAGKSTQAAIIEGHFRAIGIAIYLTSEPSQFLIGGLIRSRLLGEWQSTPECLQLLYAADRAEHLEKEILLRLKKGTNVICDRYFLSSLAYGAVDGEISSVSDGGANHPGFEWLMHLNSQFVIPDLAILLDISAQTGAERIAANGKSIELFEKTEILEKVRKNYALVVELFKNEMAVEIINGNRTKEEVFNDVKIAIEKIIKK